MSIFGIIMLAIALSMDTFAVSVSCAISNREFNLTKWLKLGFWLAIFQGGMPILGWLSGFIVSEYIMQFGHWVAFILLSIVGVNMIIDGVKSHCNQQCRAINYNSLSTILKLGVATSIDAFSVGFSFSLIDVSLWVAAPIITAVTFIFAILGCFTGAVIGNRFGGKSTIIGGIILIGIGSKIIIEQYIP